MYSHTNLFSSPYQAFHNTTRDRKPGKVLRINEYRNTHGCEW